MATTVIAWGDPKAKKAWSTALAHDVDKNTWFTRRFVGKGNNNIIEQKTELEGEAGDTVQFDLCVEFKSEPVEGDNRAEGTEETLRFYTDEVKIDQTRKPASAGGRMSRKRTVHNLRTTARGNLNLYWSAFFDEMYFMYLSGARGMNENFKTGLNYTGRAQNPFQAPDTSHILYGGSATSKATLTASDKMTRSVIEKANTKAEMMHATDPDSASMVPVMIEGSKRYVVVMSPFQAYDMRTDAGAGNWLDIQKAAAAAEGSKNRIFAGGLGMIDDTVLHKHENAIRFNDYGAGGNVQAARALMLARQAGVVAYGTPNGRRGIWIEDKRDYENEPVVVGGFILGCKKTRFNNKDFGVIAIDTAAADPNAA
ncbi:N4-gp56 family major capsid protein [Mesobacterium pallidum]|uniref:N4-gp56 family major capsid protein n=1 Tax=Mesobacterium pallidum TaxID=2872037 RepID=UPI001EE18E56|nr:N4-gp56 family major capsid protein [Mesobacterium pallidum]